MRDVLKGIKVVDLTQIGAGPTCTMLLGDFGAEVVKVEPLSGDIGRALGPPWYSDQSPIHIGFNRGKKSIAVDLKQEEGAALVRRLADQADILVESFRPGTLDKFGLGPAQLEQDHPGLIYCSVSGYGQTGPFAFHPGVDGIMQAASGLMGLIGTAESGPMKVQAPIVDVFTGYVAALGCMTALIERSKTGKGRHIDASLFGSAVALQQSAVTAYLGDPVQPAKLGSAAPYSAPNEAYPTADGWIMIAAYMVKHWPRFCSVIGRPDLTDDIRFANSADRVVNRLELFAQVAAAMKTRTTDEWLPLLEAQDILCSRVAGYEDVIAHEQTQFSRLIATMEHSSLGSLKTPGNPVNARQMNAAPFAPPPLLGEHTRSILADLGLDAGSIDDLLKRAIVSADAGR
ncbi:CaiB/BaiF CoA transferase family protein [Devosia honganensis]|uniref:CaiB/BaiF CoA transferase family protein n=1 Tax=Devosia honganensis TaxID=1610527 RepID=A0ABV7WZ39_9HYPH